MASAKAAAAAGLNKVCLITISLHKDSSIKLGAPIPASAVHAGQYTLWTDLALNALSDWSQQTLVQRKPTNRQLCSSV
jgi:hypothetical protein